MDFYGEIIVWDQSHKNHFYGTGPPETCSIYCIPFLAGNPSKNSFLFVLRILEQIGAFFQKIPIIGTTSWLQLQGGWAYSIFLKNGLIFISTFCFI